MFNTKLAPIGAILALLFALDSAGPGSASQAAERDGVSVSAMNSHSRVYGFPSSKAFTPLITKYAKAYGVPVALAHAVVRLESNFRPGVTGRAGEVGLMQIKYATAQMMGYKGSRKALYDPDSNLKFGMKYLAKARQLGGGSTCGTILKYNAGHGARKMTAGAKAYCSKVKKLIN